MNRDSNWEYKKISEFAKVTTGGTPSTVKEEYWKNGTIPWLASGNLKDCRLYESKQFITKLGLDNSAAKMMPPKTVLIALTGATTGQTAILEFKASANQSVTGILPSEEHYPEFLFYYLRTQRKRILTLSYGAAQPHISQGFVKELCIPLPPLQTQRKVASILEKAESVREKRKEANRLTNEFLKSAFLEMFGSPIKNPKKWEIGKIGENCLVESGGTPSTEKKEYWEHGKIPWVGSTVCKDNFVEEAKQFITEEGLENSSAKVFKKKTTLIALVGATIGKTGFLTFDSATNQNIAGLYPNNKNLLIPEYIFFSAQYMYPKFLALSRSGFKMANLSFVRGSEIPLPPVDQQQKFAVLVQKVEKLKRKQQESKKEFDNLFNSLMQKAFKEN